MNLYNCGIFIYYSSFKFYYVVAVIKVVSRSFNYHHLMGTHRSTRDTHRSIFTHPHRYESKCCKIEHLLYRPAETCLDQYISIFRQSAPSHELCHLLRAVL